MATRTVTGSIASVSVLLDNEEQPDLGGTGTASGCIAWVKQWSSQDYDIPLKKVSFPWGDPFPEI